MLCHFCQNLVFVPIEEVSVQNADWFTDPRFIGDPDTWYTCVHQPSRTALELSAGRGCRLCAMFWFQLFEHNGSFDPHRDNDREVASILLFIKQLSWDEGYDMHSLWRYLRLHCGERFATLDINKPVSDEVNTMLDLSCVLSSRPDEQCTPIGSAIDNHTGSDYNMDLIKTWIRHCQRGHQYCNTEVSSQMLPLLPTRVIEIETDGQARVTETKGMRAEYLTLSYCWGQGKRLVSTLGSGLYEQFKQKLPFDDTMPKTFRDALQVTKALGYRYLWIDALCIIQDDLEDVGKEMARMGGIYRQSTLTILAANGPDTDSGLFSKRDARGSKPCNVQITLKRDNSYLRRHVSIQTTGHFRHSALQTRGWVLQEEVLSGRLLTFNNDTVEWSCIKTFARENCPCMTTFSVQKEVSDTTFYRPNEAMRLIVRRPDIFNKFSQSGSAPKRNNHFDTWYDMVTHYSWRTLSVDSDKLLAIAGLASLMGKHFNLTYVTGLWKEDLQVGLCWSVTSRNGMFRKNGPRSITENFPDYLAPTWSWASAHGMCVNFFKPRSNRLPEDGLQVIDVEVAPLAGTPATLGYIQFAKLSVCTKMRRIFLGQLEPILREHARPAVNEEGPLSVHAFDAHTKSCVGSVSLDSVKVYENIWERHSTGRIIWPICSAMEETAGKTGSSYQLLSDGYEAWCVPCLTQVTQGEFKEECEIVCLVLTPLNADRREYRRIGLMWIENAACNRFMAGEDLHEDREIIHIL